MLGIVLTDSFILDGKKNCLKELRTFQDIVYVISMDCFVMLGIGLIDSFILNGKKYTYK